VAGGVVGFRVAFVGLRIDVGRVYLVVLVLVVMVVVVFDCGGDGSGGGDGVFDDGDRVIAVLSPLFALSFFAATKLGSNISRIVGLIWKVVSFQAAVDLVNPSANCRSLLTQRMVNPRTFILSLHANTSIEVRFSERLSPGDSERSTASNNDLQSVTSGDSQTVRIASSAPCLRSTPCVD